MSDKPKPLVYVQPPAVDDIGKPDAETVLVVEATMRVEIPLSTLMTDRTPTTLPGLLTERFEIDLDTIVCPEIDALLGDLKKWGDRV